MANRTDVLKLLDKPGLTGLEAAKLILGEAWRRDRRQKKVLTDQEISRIKKTLAPEERDSYNSYVELYQRTWKMLDGVVTTALEAEKFILKAIMLLQFSITDYMTREELLATPQIVTEKQYKELWAEQKQEAFRNWVSLIDVLDTVAEGLASQEIQDAWQEPDENGDTFVHLLHFLEEAHPDLYRETVQLVLEFIESGEPKPVQLSPEAKQLYKKTVDEMSELIHDEEARISEAMVTQKWEKKSLEVTQYLNGLIDQEASDEARLSLSKERIISGLKALLKRDGIEEMSQEDLDLLQEYSFIRHSELINAGIVLPGYHPQKATPERGWGGVAILQDPEPEDLDEKGHYSRDMWKDFLTSGAFFKKMWDWESPVSDPEAFEKQIKELQKRIKLDLRLYLLFRTVLEEVSEILDIDLLEDIRPVREETESLLSTHNFLAGLLRKGRSGKHLKRTSLEIRLEKLQPTEKSIAQLRRKLSTSPDQSFWKNVGETLKYSSDQAEKENSALEAIAEDAEDISDKFRELMESSEA